MVKRRRRFVGTEAVGLCSRLVVGSWWGCFVVGWTFEIRALRSRKARENESYSNAVRPLAPSSLVGLGQVSRSRGVGQGIPRNPISGHEVAMAGVDVPAFDIFRYTFVNACMASKSRFSVRPCYCSFHETRACSSRMQLGLPGFELGRCTRA